MSKLLSVLIAGIFSVVATTGYAQDKKADAPKAEMSKSGTKAGKPAKKAKSANKAKKAKADMKKAEAPKK